MSDLDGQLYGVTTAEVNRLSELHGIISAGLNSLHDTLVDLDGDAQQEAWADAAESLTAELEPFLAGRPADEPTEADPLRALVSELYAIAGRLVRFEWLATDIDLDDHTHNNVIALGTRIKAVIDSLPPRMVHRRALVGGRSAAPTRDEVVEANEQTMAAALAPFGWTCGPEFWQRYYSDPWVFNLANAVERLSRSAAPTREQDAALRAATSHLIEVLTSNWPLVQLHDTALGAASQAVIDLLSRSAAAPPEDAALAVIRRLRTGWEPDIPCIGPEVWCWFHPDDDEPQPLTEAELAVIEATKEAG